MADLLTRRRAEPPVELPTVGPGPLRDAVLAAGLAAQVGVVAASGRLLLLVVVPAALLVLCSRQRGPVGLLRLAGAAGVLVTAPLLVPDLAAADTVQLLGLALLAVQVVHAAGARTRRDLQTSLLVAAALMVLAASYGPDAVAGAPLVVGWVALLVAVVLLVRQRDTEGVDAVAVADAPAPGRTALPVALALVLGTVAFLLLPLPSEPFQLGGQRGAQGGTGAGPAVGRSASLSGDAVDLRSRGDLSDAPVLRVPGDAPLLWRSQVFDTWDGRRWSLTGSVAQPVAGPPYVLPVVPGTTRTDRVERLRDAGVVFAPGHVQSVEAAGGQATAVDGTLELSRPADYTVTSALPELDPATLRTLGPGTAEPRWLSLPPATSPRVVALAQEITAGAATQYDAVLAVETWLERNGRYDLDSPVPERGQDAVERFLLTDLVGYCEQYAAAETVLLRAVGIPARFVTGLAYGEEEDGGTRLYREEHLHAWVEVSYEGVGWSTSDPTDGVPLADDSRSLRERLVALVAALADLPGGRVGLAVALLVVSGLGALLARRLLRRRGRRRDAEPPRPVPAGRPALAAFLRLDGRQVSRGRGRWPHESLAEVRDRWRLGVPAGEALQVVEAECYAAAPPPAAVSAGAVAVLDAAVTTDPVPPRPA